MKIRTEFKEITDPRYTVQFDINTEEYLNKVEKAKRRADQVTVDMPYGIVECTLIINGEPQSYASGYSFFNPSTRSLAKQQAKENALRRLHLIDPRLYKRILND